VLYMMGTAWSRGEVSGRQVYHVTERVGKDHPFSEHASSETALPTILTRASQAAISDRNIKRKRVAIFTPKITSLLSHVHSRTTRSKNTRILVATWR
jgi:hypothetical protein